VEDSLDLDSRPDLLAPPVGRDVLRVAVVRVPRMSNITDMDALTLEPGVSVRLATTPAQLDDADLVVLPGTRSTVADLTWLRDRRLDVVLAHRAAQGRPVLGVCGGMQMLGEVIEDDVESSAGTVSGLGLLPVRTTYRADKVLALATGSWRGHDVGGYQIHHGRAYVDGGEPFLDGCRVGAVFGTTWHGIFEHDDFRRAFLTEIASIAGRAWLPGTVSFAQRREARLDTLGDLVDEHLDADAVWQLIEQGVPRHLPRVQLTVSTAPEVAAP
jgi:adenosylcobyric acid synthase